jgi:hypothetical protein
MQEANHCDTNEQLLDRARMLNGHFGEPMKDTEVINCAASAWDKTVNGNNWFGRGNYGSRLALAEVDRLVSDPYALALLNWIEAHHGPDNTFMVADGLVREHLKGWPRRQLSSGANLTFRFAWRFSGGLACASLRNARANQHSTECRRPQGA